jgi:hypothetical protein
MDLEESAGENRKSTNYGLEGAHFGSNAGVPEIHIIVMQEDRSFDKLLWGAALYCSPPPSPQRFRL